MDEVGQPITTNPFASTAVAKIDTRDDEQVTVETRAVDDATRHLANYLRPVPGEIGGSPGTPGTSPRRGSVLAVVGDYGAGKTHLAIHLLRTVEQAPTEPDVVVHATYLEASPDGFDKLFRDFTQTLSRNDVIDTLRDYYADLVAEMLDGSEYTSETAQLLRDRVLDPDSVVEGLGLISSRLVRRLQKELTAVTQTESFGIALTMLLRRREYADDVWAWLVGEPPTPALVRRGITKTISGEDMALEALGVFAYVYGRRNHRFVMVVDELDKIMTRSRTWPRGPAAGFKKLFDVFQAAGGFLIVVGLPDLFDDLGADADQRIVHRVIMSGLQPDDVRTLIVRTHQQVFGRARLTPFSDNAPELLAKLTGGTARQVIRLCNRAYQMAIRQQSNRITDQMIQSAASIRDDLPTLESVSDQVRRTFNRRGLTFERGRWVGTLAGRVDFWVTAGMREAGCAVLLTTSILSEDDLHRLSDQAHQVRVEVEGAETLLVIVGYLNSDLLAPLTEAFHAEPIEYGRHDFADELSAAVDRALDRIQRRGGENVSGRVYERLRWIHQQQMQAQFALERLGVRVEEIGLTLGQLPTSLRREFRDVPTAKSTVRTSADTPLPRPVVAVFDEATRALTAFRRTETLIESAMRLDLTPDQRTERQQAARVWLETPSLYPAVGVTSVLLELVTAFQVAVTTVFTRLYDDGPETAREHLGTLCFAYEAMYDGLQMSKLDDHRPDTESDDISPQQGAWAGHWGELRDQFDQLARKVEKAALPLLATRQ